MPVAPLLEQSASERRLADAARAHHRDEGMSIEQFTEHGKVVVAADKCGGGSGR
jgi:hypothetical protein